MTHYVMELNSGVVYHTQPADTVAWMWAMMTHFARALSPRAAPSLAGRVIGAPRWGETVMLGSWYTSADGWIWGRLHRGGTTLYVAVGRPAGKPEANDYLAMAGAGGTDCDVDALARAVIRGEYGVGATCRNVLGARYKTVQRRVNQMLRWTICWHGIESPGVLSFVSRTVPFAESVWRHFHLRLSLSMCLLLWEGLKLWVSDSVQFSALLFSGFR